MSRARSRPRLGRASPSIRTRIPWRANLRVAEGVSADLRLSASICGYPFDRPRNGTKTHENDPLLRAPSCLFVAIIPVIRKNQENFTTEGTEATEVRKSEPRRTQRTQRISISPRIIRITRMRLLSWPAPLGRVGRGGHFGEVACPFGRTPT